MELENLIAVYIDDEPINLMLAQAYGAAFNLDIKTFEDPEEGLEYILNNHIDILYTDYMMPNIDGIELIKRFRKVHDEVPVIVITAAGDDQDLKLNVLEAGATDFLTKPIEMSEFKARSLNLLALRTAQLKLKDKALLLEDEVKKATEEIQNREHETLMVLGRTAEYKDADTANHTIRVAHYSKLLARKYGLDEDTQDIIFYAAPFHDIGKVGIPDFVLLKEGRLTEEEFSIMKKHVQIGNEILKDTKSAYLIAGQEIAFNHHEKYDGTGYPLGIAGEKIPLAARIVSIADVFDALTSVRPYKKSWTIQDAILFLMNEKGSHFDPKLVDLFIESIEEVKKFMTIFTNKHLNIQIEQSEIPWLKIFTNEDYKELSQTPKEIRENIFDILDKIERLMIEYYQPEKINIASFGNYVPHVHFHIMARFKEDSFFPEPMWGKKQREGKLELPSFEIFCQKVVKVLEE